jgi:hypothetical protein
MYSPTKMTDQDEQEDPLAAVQRDVTRCLQLLEHRYQADLHALRSENAMLRSIIQHMCAVPRPMSVPPMGGDHPAGSAAHGTAPVRAAGFGFFLPNGSEGAVPPPVFPPGAPYPRGFPFSGAFRQTRPYTPGSYTGGTWNEHTVFQPPA